MFRAPICTTSAISAICSRPASSIASVTMSSPVSRRTAASSASPSVPRPWNAYGDVRGLNAPARSARAPAAWTARAVAKIWVSCSTEQGPATISTSAPPTETPPGSFTTVGSGRHSRATIR